MKRTIIPGLIVTILLLSCSIFGQGNLPQLSNEEHAIISVVLDSMMQNHTPETIDVYDKTSTGTSASVLHIAFEHDSIEVPPTLISNYASANRERYELDMDKLPDYVMLKDSDEAEPYSGYYAFTRPGISEDGMLAIVEYSFMSAPLAGCGMAALLEKKDGEWVIVWHEMMWIS